MRIVTRREWGARPARSRHAIATPTPRLWLHHAAGEFSGAGGVRQIQAFHMDTRGYSDVAYSFLVDDDGTVFEGRGVGIAGGHTKGDNTLSHAICALGNYENREPGPRLIDAIAELAAHGYRQGWWSDSFTGGHRDAPGAQTACPGRYLQSCLPEIRALVAAQINVPSPPPLEDLMGLFKDEGQAMAFLVVQAYEVLLGVTLAEDGRPSLPEIAHWQNRMRATDPVTVWNEIAGSDEARLYRKRKAKVGL